MNPESKPKFKPKSDSVSVSVSTPLISPQPPQPPQPDEARARLSVLADGDMRDVSEFDRACAGWRNDVDARRTWHCYQLIGDVMRSEELARPAARDAAFLASFRERLAAEPVVLAPAPLPVVASRLRHVWLMPAAAVAGFVLVAGALVAARLSQPGVEAGPGFAAAPSGVMPVSRSASGLNNMVTNSAPGGDALLRDERLDEYLRAHQFARGGVVLSVPSTAVRRVELTVSAIPAR